jgi:hypothetical protein
MRVDAFSSCNQNNRRYDYWKKDHAIGASLVRCIYLDLVAGRRCCGGAWTAQQFGRVVSRLWFFRRLDRLFFVGWWLPYTSWLALGEFIFFLIYPGLKAPFVAFAVLSFVTYARVALHYPNWSSAPELLIWPAATVTVTYLILRIARKAWAVAG